MNHSFSQHISDPLKCRVCGYDEISHTDKATCDACQLENEVFVQPIKQRNSLGMFVTSGQWLLCKSCMTIEIEREKAPAPEPLPTAADLLKRDMEVLQEVKVQSDIFNAKMVAIVELQTVINNDSSIASDQKNFKLAEVISNRFHHLKEVLIPDKRREILDAENEMRAIQTKYNELAQTLRADERAKIKLKDINYKPEEPKEIKKHKSPSTKSVDRMELAKHAKLIVDEFPHQSAIALSTLQAIVTAQNITIEGAANVYRQMLGGQAK